MRVITNRQLSFTERGTVPPDTYLDLTDKDAQQLLATGAVRVPPRPTVIYETKVVRAATAADPFRDSDNADDAEPTKVDPSGDRGVSQPKLVEAVKRITSRKRGRPRKRPAE